ncbi:MAG: radical SAM protein [Candidatus Latescibacterota bacterium]
MKIVASAGKDDIAVVYIAEFENGTLVECVEAVQPPVPREQKWVIMVSTLYGCPVGCAMCDAGGYYHGRVSKENLLAQIDYLIRRRFPDGGVPCKQFKIQFARMGDPAFNPAVLDVLESLPELYQAPGLLPSISTIAPAGTGQFFEKLRLIKCEKYSGGRFQFQFSIHTTDEILRDRIIPAKKWGFAEMAEYGRSFYEKGDRKITLNFALMENVPVDPDVLLGHFSPDIFLIKITPVNATYHATEHGLASYIDPLRAGEDYSIVNELRAAGYQVIVSIGEAEENYIGSNCGQFVARHIRAGKSVQGAYTYPMLPANGS